MTIKAVIVDDERLARVELKHLLGQMKDGPAIKVVGEAANVDDAVTLIEGQAVDLVFLDIQMPGKNGFELLEMLTTCPTVIFTTAYDEYAIKAFAANALDYLLKPIEPERLQQALGKAADVDSKPTPEEDSQERMAINDKVFIKDGEKCFFVPVADVIAFASIGNYCRVIFPGGQPMIRKTLQQLEDRLPAEPFFRASRQHIINLKMVTSVDVAMSGNLEATLTNGLKVEMSRRQSQAFKDNMSF